MLGLGDRAGGGKSGGVGGGWAEGMKVTSWAASKIMTREMISVGW